MNKENGKSNENNDVKELMDKYLELMNKVDEAIEKLDSDKPNVS